MPRVYVDGIFDLFHVGHVRTLKYIQEHMGDVIVGVISDDVANTYKRKPVINDTHRCEILESCKYVTETIVNVPLIVTNEFIKKHKIDVVVHSFSCQTDKEKQSIFFAQIGDKFQEIEYQNGESTSAIINRIQNEKE